MAYLQGGKIEAVDINGFVSTGTPNFNNIWSVGSGDSGYGQTALPIVAVGDIVREDPWKSLVANIINAASHQNTTTITAIATPPATGGKIEWLSALSTNLVEVNTNRLNAAAHKPQVAATDILSATSTSSWVNNLTMKFTFTFSSNDAARYFFNAGGQITIQCSHPAGVGSSINQLISDICGDAGTIVFSSPTATSPNLATATIVGTVYDGVTKINPAPPTPGKQVINKDAGFHSFFPPTTPFGTNVEIFRQYGDFVYDAYETGTFMSISVSYNGTGEITFTVLYDEVPNGATVSLGTETTLTVRRPSDSPNITNTWGTPTLALGIPAISYDI